MSEVGVISHCCLCVAVVVLSVYHAVFSVDLLALLEQYEPFLFTQHLD